MQVPPHDVMPLSQMCIRDSSTSMTKTARSLSQWSLLTSMYLTSLQELSSQSFSSARASLEIWALSQVATPDLNSYTPEDTHVVLINGKVEVSNTKGGSYTRLYPGEDAHLQSDGNFILAEVDLDSYVYWKDGYFYFDNVTLKDIMQNLGRWYNVNIEFRNKEAMEYKMHFISDRTKDLEHTISLLNRMKKVTVTLQGNTLTVD